MKKFVLLLALLLTACNESTATAENSCVAEFNTKVANGDLPKDADRDSYIKYCSGTAGSIVGNNASGPKKTDIRGLRPGMTVEEINNVIDEALDHAEILYKTCGPSSHIEKKCNDGGYYDTTTQKWISPPPPRTGPSGLVNGGYPPCRVGGDNQRCSPLRCESIVAQDVPKCEDHQRPVSFKIESGVGRDTPQCRAFPVM